LAIDASTPTDLRDLVIAGHGGRRRWTQISRFRASVSVTGAIRARMERPGLLDDMVLEGDTRVRQLTITPFPQPGEYASRRPARLGMRTIGGRAVTGRAASSPGGTPWDEVQVGTFAAEATWHHLVAPFIVADDDVDTEEIWPWREDAHIWRALLVTFPQPMAMFSRTQTFYIDRAGLVRRSDCELICPGGGPAVDYPSRYREFDGIMVATRRAVYPRGPDGDADRSALAVGIDIGNVAFR
jgi:hypothetical protein